LVITAVVHEQRPVSEVASSYGVHRSWIYRLLSRYKVEGEAAFASRSRRPHRSPTAIGIDVVERILKLRAELESQGLDAGPDTIAWHLATHHDISVSAATIRRRLHKAGAITPQPKKRPKCSYIRFEADLPNETWQTDFTHHRLRCGRDTEIVSFLDDHSRYALTVAAYHRVTGPAVVQTFRKAAAAHGIPASVLSDNGMVYTTRFAGGKGGRNQFEHHLHQLGVVQKHSRPNHPTTCGKVERFQQTMKKWLRRQQPQPGTLAELQNLLDRFVHGYNTARPHRSLNRRTPLAAYQARPKATPTGSTKGTHYRIRHDTIDDSGVITLRHGGRLHHIGIGRTHARTHILMLIDGLHIRVTDATTGTLLRELTLDPTRDYQPQKRDSPNP
jgi:transposase InsO family protein